MKKSERLAREAAARQAATDTDTDDQTKETMVMTDDNPATETVSAAPAANYYWFRVTGLLPQTGTWATLLDKRTDSPLTDAEAESFRDEFSGLLDVVNRCYREGVNAVLTLDRTRANVQSFAAITVDLVRE